MLTKLFVCIMILLLGTCSIVSAVNAEDNVTILTYKYTQLCYGTEEQDFNHKQICIDPTEPDEKMQTKKLFYIRMAISSRWQYREQSVKILLSEPFCHSADVQILLNFLKQYDENSFVREAANQQCNLPNLLLNEKSPNQ